MTTSEGQLRLSGLKKKKYERYISDHLDIMLNMELIGNKKRGRQRRFMDVMKEDMQKVDGTEEDARDGVRLRSPLKGAGGRRRTQLVV